MIPYKSRALSPYIPSLLISLLLWLVCCGPAHGYIIINAPMTDTNSSGWVMGGNPNSAILTGNGAIDQAGSGWLRLTNNTGDQTGFAYNSTPFDLSAGALIQFDYASWGGSGADGYTVYLFDANVPTFNIGAFGGSLGYAQKLPPAVPTAVPGISGGYVGIGVDEFGNFSNPTEGRYLGSGANPNRVTIRGSVLGFGGGAAGQTQNATSYPWIYTSGYSGSLWYNGGTRPSQFGNDYRKVIIRISPAPNPVADVWVQFGYNTTPVRMITSRALPAISASQQLKIGYAASTGGSTNYHEIRNLLITSIDTSTAVDLGITKTAVSTGTSTEINSAMVGDSFQYLITARNYGPNSITATGVGIVDNFPAGVTPGSWSCSGTGGASCGAGSGSGNLNTTANLPLNGVVTYRVNATLNAVPPGNLLTNSASLAIPGAVSDYFTGNNSSSSTIDAYGPPTVVKSFTPATIMPGGTARLNITLTNPNNIDVTGVTFTDDYPTSPGAMRNANTANRSNSCGGSSSSTNNGVPDVRLTGSGNRIPANGSCTVSINVTATTPGTYNNSTGPISTTNLGTGIADIGTLVVMSAPTAAQAFVPNQIGINGSSTLTVTLTNPTGAPMTGVAFTDNYPANLVNGATADAATTCAGGTVTAADGGTSLAFSGGTIPANSSCTVTVNVSSDTAGTYNNSTGTITTANAGNGSAAVASLAVLEPLGVTKTFTPATILPNGSSVLRVTLSNPNTTAVTGGAFTDNYPTNLVNLAAANGATTCSGGTVTAAGNGDSLALSGATIPAGGSCTVTVNVTSATAAAYVNSTGTVSTINAGNAAPASGTLVVMAPPTATKVFAPNQIAIGGSTLLTVTLQNPNSVPITGAAFSDLYPANMVNRAVPAAATSCGGTVTAASNGPSLALSGGTIPAGGSCTVTANVTITATGTFNNSTGPITTTNAGAGTAATANLNGPQAPTVALGFAPASIVRNGSSLLTVTLTNPNGFPVTGTAFTDSYPANLVNAAAANGATTCAGGTVTAANNGTSLALSGGTIPANGSCTVTVNVTSASAGTYNNSSGAVTTSNTGSGTAAAGTLVVMAPPAALKSFTPASVLVNTPSLLTITLTNPNPNATAITGVAFTDNYPANLVNTASAAPATTCSGGTVTAANNGTSVALAGATIPASGSCTVTVKVTSSSANSYNNSTGTVSSANAGNGTAASAVLTTTLLPAPTVVQSFTPNQTRLNGTSVLTITLTNGSSTPISGAAFSDSYPANLVNTASASGATTCSGGTVTAADNGTSVALSGATIPANGSCTVTVNVTSATAGSYLNSTGPVTSANAVSAAAASATLAVLSPPAVAKAFVPASVVVNTASVLTITLTNPNGTAITGASFTDSYPANLVNSASASGATTCAGGTVTAANNGTSVALSGGTVPANGSCTVTVNVTSAIVNSYVNSTGPVTTGNAGNGTAAGATLTTTRLPAPTAVKSFAPTQIATNGTSLLTITLTNPSSINITGVAFSDTMPSSPGQMSIAASSVLTSSCGGTGTIAGDKRSFSISGGTIPANGSCAVSVTVTAVTLGSYANTTSSVTSTNALTGASASANLTVALLTSPSVLKAFSPNQVGINGISVLSVTLSNTNSQAITGAAFTDNYPAGLLNSASAGAATNCAGGSVSAANNGNSLSLSGATIPAGGSCTVTVNVAAAAAGAYLNSTGPVTTANASTGTAASATLNVLQAPAASQAFAPAAVLPNATSVLTITLTNPNGIAITGAAFTENYPANLFNSASASGSTTCIGGSVSAANNGNSVSLSGATIPGDGSCTVTVNVRSAATGSHTSSTGPIASSNAGTGSSASGTLVVMVPPTVAASFTPASVQFGTVSVLTITLTNPNGAIITGAAFTDNYPAGLANWANSNGATTCAGGSVTAAGNGDSVALSGASVPANGSCTVTVNVAGAAAGSYTTSTGAVSTGNAGNGAAATATLYVYAPPTVTKSFGAATLPSGGSTALTLTLANPAANLAAITGVQVDDNFPAGLTLRNTSFTFIPAGCGTVTRTSGAASAAGDGNLRFSAAGIAPGASCRVSVNVTSSSVGSLTNSTDPAAATGPAALTGANAEASLSVYALPLISVLKSAGSATANPGQTIVYTVQVVNTGAGVGTSVVLTDDLSPYGAFKINSYGPGAPFAFIDDPTPSGLALGTPEYSYDKGSSWFATPLTDGGGNAPPGSDGSVTNWRIPMTGSIRAGGSFILNYQVVVK